LLSLLLLDERAGARAPERAGCASLSGSPRSTKGFRKKEVSVFSQVELLIDCS